MDSILVETQQNDSNTWQTIRNKHNMESAIIKHNHTYFYQLEGSLPSRPSLPTILGDGHNKKYDEILQGTYIPDSNIPTIMK